MRADNVRPLLTSVALHSLEAEQAVLGSLLVDSSAWSRLAGKLDAEDFFRPDHAVIFRAIAKVAGAGRECDVITVSSRLQAAGALDDAGGMAYVGKLARETATAANAESYAEVVRERSMRRRLAQLAESIQRAVSVPGKSDRTAEDLLADAQRSLYELQTKARTGGGLVSASDLTRMLFEDLERRRDQPAGMPIGLADFDELTGGLEPGELIVLAGRPGMGKAQPLDEPVLTPSGWRPMGALRVGECVTGPDGAPRRVVGVFPQGAQQVWRLRFADGREVRCTKEHLWTVKCSRWPGGERTVQTDELARLLAIGRNRLRIRTVAYHGTDDGVPVVGLDPYVLGCWLGDGDPVGRITGLAPQFELLQAAGAEWGVLGSDIRRRHVRVAALVGLRAAIRALGMFGKRAHEKQVPQQYMGAPRSQRLALLQGLLDTDGWVERFGAVRFCSSSRQLAQQVRELVWSLGGEATLAKKPTSHRDAYVVNLRVPNPIDLFRQPDKRARCQLSRKISPRILAAEPTDEFAECQCIKVDRDDGLYVTRGHIVTHNTALLGGMSITAAAKGPVAVFSAEMPSLQLMRRNVASVGDVSLSKLRRAQLLTDFDWAAISQAGSDLSSRQLWIDETPQPTLAHVRAECMGLKLRAGSLGLVLVDYIQLVQGPGGNRYEQLRDVAYGCKALAKQLAVPVVVLAQINRGVEARDEKRPRISDLRDSGAIEEAADIIGLLYCEGYYNRQYAMPHVLECDLQKVRNGEPGECLWYFDGDRSRITVLDSNLRGRYLALRAQNKRQAGGADL